MPTSGPRLGARARKRARRKRKREEKESSASKEGKISVQSFIPKPVKKKRKKKKAKPSGEDRGDANPPDEFVTSLLDSFEERSGTLSDWLNPVHRYYWKDLKGRWSKLRKADRKKIILRDKTRCEAMRKEINHPFHTMSDDHCETAPEAYEDIACVLHAIAKELGKTAGELKIYDPYYCDGAVVRNLAKLGFPNVYNKCEDFYETLAQGVPDHDVLLTNPPYSNDHIERLMKFVKENKKPTLLLMPNYVTDKEFFEHKSFVYVIPRKRYVYWTPKGLRPKSKFQNHASSLGVRTSPFVSFWYISRGSLRDKTLQDFYRQLGQEDDQSESSERPSCLLVRRKKDLPSNVRPKEVLSYVHSS